MCFRKWLVNCSRTHMACELFQNLYGLWIVPELIWLVNCSRTNMACELFQNSYGLWIVSELIWLVNCSRTHMTCELFQKMACELFQNSFSCWQVSYLCLYTSWLIRTSRWRVYESQSPLVENTESWNRKNVHHDSKNLLFLLSVVSKINPYQMQNYDI